MTSPADQGLLDAIAALAGTLRQLREPGMIIGGIAVIAHGVPRHTADVDATIWAEDIGLEKLLGALAEHQIVLRIPDGREFARQRRVLLLHHVPSGTPLEITLAGLPFEKEALGRATAIDFAGVEIPVVSAEDLVIYKALAWRDRDRSDIERLLVLHGGRMDLDRVRNMVRQFAEILVEPRRIAEFEELVRRQLDSPRGP